MPSIKNILATLALAVVASAQVSQITDGQVQAGTSVSIPTTSTPAPVTQISDGQIQAPTAPIVTASSGVAPAPTANGTFTTGAPAAPFTGGAGMVTFSGAALGIAALAVML